MEEQAKRSPGGKLALWALYAFCGYCVWVIVRYWWVVGKIHSVPGASVEGDFGTTAGKWLGALLGMLVLGGIGSILGAVVWYTRPSRGEQDRSWSDGRRLFLFAINTTPSATRSEKECIPSAINP